MAGVVAQLVKVGAFAGWVAAFTAIFAGEPYPVFVGLLVLWLLVGVFVTDGMPYGFRRR